MRRRRRTRGRRDTAGRLGLLAEESGKKGRAPLPSDRAILSRILRRIGRILLRLAATFVIGSIALVIIYRFVDPPVTPLMLIRPIEGIGSGRFVGVDKEWTDIDDIDPILLRSILAAEDARFFSHGGIDWEAVDAARDYNRKHAGKKVRGASTITMQCARNVFLWQGRNYLRKGLEVWFTYLIEYLWGKERILEVYVNVIEWGDGTYGAAAAAEHYFGASIDELTPRQAALLSAILPNPRAWSPTEPSKHVERRVGAITKGARIVKLPFLEGDEE